MIGDRIRFSRVYRSQSRILSAEAVENIVTPALARFAMLFHSSFSLSLSLLLSFFFSLFEERVIYSRFAFQNARPEISYFFNRSVRQTVKLMDFSLLSYFVKTFTDHGVTVHNGVFFQFFFLDSRVKIEYTWIECSLVNPKYPRYP